MTLTLTGRKREVALGIKSEELDAYTGMTVLTTKLNDTFGRNKTDQIYDAYVKFETINQGELSMTDYIHEFDKRNAELVKFEFKLPKEVLACKLLYCANLDKQERQIALSATTELEFESMKSSLRRIFGNDHTKKRDAEMSA